MAEIIGDSLLIGSITRHVAQIIEDSLLIGSITRDVNELHSIDERLSLSSALIELSDQLSFMVA